MSIRKLAILPLIALFISCTVTKRVHRPGFHVQWRKVERTKAPEKLEKQSFESESVAEMKEPPSKLNRTSPNEKSEVVMSPMVETSMTDSIEFVQLEPVENHFSVETSKLESVFKTKSLIATPQFQKSTRPIFWRMSSQSLRKTGVVFMCIGGMFLFASLLVYFGAFSGNGGGAWLNFFLDLIDISGWFWLLFFIVAIILISYLFFLLVTHVLGGPAVGALVGLAFLALGIFLYVLGNRREIEP